MEKHDIGFFEEVQGVLENQRKATRFGNDGYLNKTKERKAKGEKKEPKAKGGPREAKPKSLLSLQATSVANPCQGCPLEGRPKHVAGVGDITKAKLLVISEKITEGDLLEKTYRRLDQFMPFFLKEGFAREDIYFTALTRSYTSTENLEALEYCTHYLRQEILRDNIKCILITGLRPFQLLIDKKRNTVFRARGQIFQLLGKPAIVTFESPGK